MKRTEQYQDFIARLYPEISGTGLDENNNRILSRVVTFQVTDKCNLACSYCYQINKGERRMKFETAKKLIDMLLTDDPRLDNYVSLDLSPAIILEFIGGEPFLNIELIEQICDYFYDKAIEMMHPWAEKFRISICSNGVLYFKPEVQRFLSKYRNNISFSVTIDGNKELHDSCRVFPNGDPSYDLAVAASKDWMSKGYEMGSKITIAPGNLMYMYDAICHMVDLGYDEIHANVVYEKGWTLEHAKEYYKQLIRIADYWIDNNIVETHYLALFEENFFCPKDEDDLQNWCFTAGTKVYTNVGCANIEEIKVGNLILTKEGTYQPVTDVKKRTVTSTVDIKISTGTVFHSTPEHPFLVRCNDGTSSWVSAGSLKRGDILCTHRDANLIATVVDVAVNNSEVEVFNLTVAGDHTFIIDDMVIVHNCGGTGSMLSMDPDGYLFPCIRYMESSLGSEREPLSIGHVDIGIGQTEKDKATIEMLNAIDRRTESTDECFYCPIAEGCSWCFTAGTMVLTPDGEVPIETLKPGDTVMALSFSEPRCKVLSNLVREVEEEILTITVESYIKGKREIHVTKEHPFLVFSRNERTLEKWVKAEDLSEGDILYCMDFDSKYSENVTFYFSRVEEIKTDKHENKPIKVYNLNVDVEHTYVANGCIVHNCSAYNYQVNGTPDSRVTYICDMHKARSLANSYFWNTWYRKTGNSKRFKIYCPDEWALQIISKEELDKLKRLEEKD